MTTAAVVARELVVRRSAVVVDSIHLRSIPDGDLVGSREALWTG